MSDLTDLARGLLDTFAEYDVTYGRNAYNICRCCSGRVYWDEQLKAKHHSANCPVLVAYKVLGVSNEQV